MGWSFFAVPSWADSESNDSFAEADGLSLISDATISGLKFVTNPGTLIGSDNDDYFSINLNAQDRVTITSYNTSGDLNTKIYLYDAIETCSKFAC